MSSHSKQLQQQLEAAQARINDLEAQLRASRQPTEAQQTTVPYARRLQILRQIDLGIINAHSTEEIIATALRHLRELVPCQRANVVLIDMIKQDGVIFAVDYDKETAIGHGLRMPLQPDFFEGYDKRHLKVAHDFRPLQSIEFPFGQLVKEGILSGMNIMLMDRDNPIGTLGLYADKTNFFTAEHQEITVEIGNQLAIAIRQRQLSEQLARHAAELEQRVVERTHELQAGKAQVEALLNNSPNGIVLIEPDLSIQQTNTAFHKMMGCEPDECANKSLLAAIHEEHRDVVAKLVNQVIDERAGRRAEVQVLRKNGTAFEAELAVELIEGDGLVCTIQDITERKQIENAIAEERNLLRTLIDSMPDFIYAKDTQHRFILTNIAHAKARGVANPEEMVGKTDFDFFSPDLAKEFAAEEEIIFSTESPLLNHEQNSSGYAGGFTWALTNKVPLRNIKGDIIGLVGITRDITERKAQERQLRYYGSIQESVSDAVIATDMEVRIQSWNAAAERIYGWTAAEAIGHTAAEILHTEYESEEDRQRIMQEFLAKGGWQREVVQHSKDGRTLHILASTNLFKDDKGQPIGIVSVNRDITERKQATDALKKSSEEIRDLYNFAPCGYQSLDKDGLIIQINDTGLSWLGYSRDEVVGKLKITDLYTPESVQKFKENFPIFKERGWVKDLEFDVICKDGSIMHILLNSTAIYDEAGQYVQSRSTMFDITELRKAQLEIRQRENYYRALANNLPLTTVFLFDNDLRYLVVEGPDAAYPPEFMEGKTVQEVFGPEAASQILPGYQAALRGEAMTIELPANGRIYEGKFAPVFNEDEMVPNGLLVVRDVTEERAAADALRESEARYRLLAENVTDIIVQVNAAYEYIYASPSIERVLGYAPEEFVGKNTLYFIHPDDVQVAVSFRHTASYYETSQDTPRIEFRYRHKLGHWVWLERVGTPLFSEESHEFIGLVSALRDVTARHQAEDALRESEARYRLLAENVTDIIIQVNSAFEYVYASPSVERVLGYTPEEFVGKSTLYFIHPDDAQVVVSFRQTASDYEAGQDTPRVEFRYRHKLGHWVWLERVGTPLFSEESHEFIGFVAALRDITAHHQAEEALRESEGRYRLLAENIDDIIMTFSMDRVITYMSPSCERLLGFSQEEVIGKSHSEFIHPEDYPQVIDKTRQAVVLKASSYTNQFRLRHKDDQYSWYEVRTRVIYDPKSIHDTRFIAVLRDITERKQAEAALRESEERFRRAVIDAPFPIMIHAEDGEILQISKSWTELSGYAPEDIPTMADWTEKAYGERRQSIKALIDREYTRTEPLKGGEFRVRTKSGDERIWDFIAAPLGVMPDGRRMVSSMAMDITERKQADAALRASEVKYRSLVETMRGGLAIYDPDDCFTYVNDRFCELLGYSREEIIGTCSMDYVDQTDVHEIKGQLDRRQNGESSSYEIRVRRKNGTYMQLLVSGSPLLGKDGDYKGSFAVCVDITIQKDAEVALQQSLAKEKELGELKSRFVSMSSHEFRTPLATLLAAVETLVAYRSKLSEEQIDQRLEKMKVQIGHLKNIMDDVLLLSRMQARRFDFNPTKIDLDALTRSVLDEFQSRPDIKHQFEYTVSEGAQEVILDPKLMRQIINNLVSNAIKYSSAGKVVRVNLDYMDSVVTLTVRDEGIGIPETDLPHLFEPFHRAVNAEHIAGTGLGLVITKEAVELHGGAIGVESTVGVGTTFTVRIPISVPDQNGA